jgi:hypothetical protein
MTHPFHDKLFFLFRYNKPELLTSLFGELRAANLSRGSLDFRQLLPFDQHHYHGTEDIDRVAASLGWSAVQSPQSREAVAARVVNFGSGLGGPARYFFVFDSYLDRL